MVCDELASSHIYKWGLVMNYFWLVALPPAYSV